MTLRYSASGQLCSSDKAGGPHPPCGASSRVVWQMLWPAHCLAGTRPAALHPGLIVKPHDMVLRKGTARDLDAYSAFADNGRILKTTLASVLRGRNISTVVVIGLALDCCVKWSALDAAANGFCTVVVTDATAPVSEAGRQVAERELRAAGVKLVASAAQLLASVPAVGVPAAPAPAAAAGT